MNYTAHSAGWKTQPSTAAVKRRPSSRQSSRRRTSRRWRNGQRSSPPRRSEGRAKVPEWAKERWRIIQHPVDINERTDLEARTTFASIAERHLAVRKGAYVLDLDAAAYYDQFPLAPAVREYFAFKHAGGIYRMRVLPMGLKHAVWIAHTATCHLLNFDRPESVYVEPYIDNVRFVSDSKENLIQVAAEFCMRCRSAGVTLNEIDLAAYVTGGPTRTSRPPSRTSSRRPSGRPPRGSGNCSTTRPRRSR